MRDWVCHGIMTFMEVSGVERQWPAIHYIHLLNVVVKFERGDFFKGFHPRSIIRLAATLNDAKTGLDSLFSISFITAVPRRLQISPSAEKLACTIS
jgi:hypothetical protein